MPYTRPRRTAAARRSTLIVNWTSSRLAADRDCRVTPLLVLETLRRRWDSRLHTVHAGTVHRFRLRCEARKPSFESILGGCHLRDTVLACERNGTRPPVLSPRNGTNSRIGSTPYRGSGLVGLMPGGVPSAKEDLRSSSYDETATWPESDRSRGKRAPSFHRRIGTHPSSVSSWRTPRLCRNSSLRFGLPHREVSISRFFFLATQR